MGFKLGKGKRPIASSGQVTKKMKFGKEGGESGRIENYYVSVHFGINDQKAKTENDTIPSYDDEDPIKNAKFIYHGRDEQPGQPYYSLPEWYGTKDWTELSNYIPKWHKKGLENGYNIKYHIKVNKKYFDQFTTDEKKASAYQELKDNMDRFLSGYDGNQKAFVSRCETDQTGKVTDFVTIEEFKNNLSDEAYTKLYEQSNRSNIQGHDIHPTLANVSEEGKLSSGSEMRNAYNVHVSLKTPIPRDILLEWLYVVKEINEWPSELEFGFEDVEITKMDDNKAGFQLVQANNEAQ